MLTNREREFQVETGLVPRSRMVALVHALQSQSADAHAAASERTEESAEFRAALRGKAVALGEVARMVQRVLAGHPLHSPAHSSASTAVTSPMWLRSLNLCIRMSARDDEGDEGSPWTPAQH